MSNSETWPKPKKHDPSYDTETQVRFPYAGTAPASGPLHAAKDGATFGMTTASSVMARRPSLDDILRRMPGPSQHPEPTPLDQAIDAVKASQTATEGGRKFDGGKPQYGLLPLNALEENVKVLTVGAQKYEPDNWKRVPDGKRRYFDAALRHLFAFKRGEERDPETGLHHLAHALCCIQFILDLELSPTPENPPTERTIYKVELGQVSNEEAQRQITDFLRDSQTYQPIFKD